ncbi:unnamed protein product, partial [Hapterophycus canaliculatus]
AVPHQGVLRGSRGNGGRPTQGLRCARVHERGFSGAYLGRMLPDSAFAGKTLILSPLFAPISKTVQQSSNAFVVRGRESFATLVSKSEKKVSQELLSKRGIDSGRVVLSLAESTLFRKLAKPVTIPAKLWLTLKFVQRTGGGNNNDDRGEKGELGGKGATGGGGTRGRRAPEAAAAGMGSGWGGGRSKRRRKAICPPGSRGGAPGCFVAAYPAVTTP